MLKKNLHLCFSRIHCLPSSFSGDPLTLEAEDESDHSTTTTTTNTAGTFSFSTSFSNSEATTDPDFSSVFASRRFFVSSPGTSNSILDNNAIPKPSASLVVEGGVPMRKYSPDPYMDFRNSMEEMVRARRDQLLIDPTAQNESSSSSSGTTNTTDWDYLHELLLCYLSLNPKHTHKFIVGAFTDLLLSLMSAASEGSGSHPEIRRIDGGDAPTRGILV